MTHTYKLWRRYAPSLLALALVAALFPPMARAQLSLVRPITFPVVGDVRYSDDFGDPRPGGRTHEGNDLLGKKMMPLVAAVDGTISFINYPEATWGYAVGIRDSDGYEYWYLHVNNDTPGTDDGKGDGFFAYAPDIQPGNKVVKGQLVGWMGDSGDAEGTTPHLHFEIHAPGGQPFDPYQSLKAAVHIAAPNTEYPALPNEILPYASFSGGANLASGNFDSDTASELVTAAGTGGGPLVRTFEKDGTAKAAFYAYDSNFHGGVDVAVGDVDGDHKDDIVTAPGSGGGPDIRIFKADGTTKIGEFMAYDPNFHGGVKVAVADINGDGKAEIITGPGAGGGPDVRVFKLDGTKIGEFMAYDPNFHGGIDVAALAKTSGAPASIITAPGPGGGPHIRIFNAVTGVVTKEFMAYDPNFHGGVRLSAQIKPAVQLTTMPASGGGPNLKTFSLDGTETDSSMAGFEVWWRGGYDVAATPDGVIFVSSIGGRRTSVRASTYSTGGSRSGGFCRNCVGNSGG